MAFGHVHGEVFLIVSGPRPLWLVGPPEQADLTCVRKVALSEQGSRAELWGRAAELWIRVEQQRNRAVEWSSRAVLQSKPFPSVLLPWFPLSTDCHL